MTMKKLMLATAIALCLTAPAFAGGLLPANFQPSVELTSGKADDALRQLLGQPSRESVREAKELDKALQGHAGIGREAKELDKVFQEPNSQEPNSQEPNSQEPNSQEPNSQEPNSYVAGIPQPSIQYINLASGEADDTLRQLLGQPSREAEREAKELDKVLQGTPDAGQDLHLKSAQTESQAPAL
jgi:hypothetical protein